MVDRCEHARAGGYTQPTSGEARSSLDLSESNATVLLP